MKNLFFVLSLVRCVVCFGMSAKYGINQACSISGFGMQGELRCDACYLVHGSSEGLSDEFALAALEKRNGTPVSICMLTYTMAGKRFAMRSLQREKELLLACEKCSTNFPERHDLGLYRLSVATNFQGRVTLTVSSKDDVGKGKMEIVKHEIRDGLKFDDIFAGMAMVSSLCEQMPLKNQENIAESQMSTDRIPRISAAFYMDGTGKIGLEVRVTSRDGELLYSGRGTAALGAYGETLSKFDIERLKGQGDVAVKMRRKAYSVASARLEDMLILCEYGQYCYSISFNISGLNNLH